jgi:hypothetical protein
VAPPENIVASEPAPIEPPVSIVEHVDELTGPVATGLVEDEYVEELPVATEPVAPTNVMEVQAAQPEPASPIVDEPLFGTSEPTFIVQEDIEEFQRTQGPSAHETIDEIAMPAEPIVDEYVEELRPPESAPSLESFEPIVVPIESLEAIAPEYVEDVDPLGLVEPIAADYVAPSAPDLGALWEAVTPPAQAPEPTASLPMPKAAPVVEERIAELTSLETQEATSQSPLELSPEPPLEFGPELQVDITPEPQYQAEPVPTSVSPFPELRVADERGLRQIQIVISPIHSFQRLLDTEARIRALSTVNAVHLRDFRNGIATFAVAVGEAISAAEFGAVIQMLQDLHLRLEGTTQTSVELRAEDDPPAS